MSGRLRRMRTSLHRSYGRLQRRCPLRLFRPRANGGAFSQLRSSNAQPDEQDHGGGRGNDPRPPSWRRPATTAPEAPRSGRRRTLWSRLPEPGRHIVESRGDRLRFTPGNRPSARALGAAKARQLVHAGLRNRPPADGAIHEEPGAQQDELPIGKSATQQRHRRNLPILPENPAVSAGRPSPATQLPSS
jgi:hypothetical protein